MEWPKKVFFLCIYAIAGVSSPNCGDKVEVQLLFMAFNIQLIYMSNLDFLEDDAILVELSDKLYGLSDKVDKLEENLKIGLGCDKPDAPEVCNRMIGGKRKRKSRKKRGKGSMMSRKKKHMSARQPKNEYLNQARQILITYLNNPNISESSKARELRILALQLEDDAKKGGRRKRKSRKKRRKRKTKRKRRKSKRRRR